MRSARAPFIHVHHAGERGVDGILKLIELAGDDGPLEDRLSVMCDEIAAIASADVASIYAREPDDRLVMRGNHGFPRAALGAVALGIGEGIVGMVAECMRPVSAAQAAQEPSYKHVPGLGEERFPVFAGVPLISGGRVIGVLVLQREHDAFESKEIALATALGAPVTLALERRRLEAARSARLTGIAVGGPAIVLGRADVVPTSTALGDAAGDPGRALARLRDDLERACKRLRDVDDPLVGGALDRLTLTLMDQRLRDRLDAAATRPGGLREVARDYARTPYKLGSEPGDRVAEIEELCVLLGTAEGAAPLRPGAVWMGHGVGTFVALAAVARGAAAVIAASDAVTPAAAAIARAAGLPIVTEVSGLFAWARPGDLVVVDGEAGIVLVNPPPTDVERVRRARVR